MYYIYIPFQHVCYSYWSLNLSRFHRFIFPRLYPQVRCLNNRSSMFEAKNPFFLNFWWLNNQRSLNQCPAGPSHLPKPLAALPLKVLWWKSRGDLQNQCFFFYILYIYILYPVGGFNHLEKYESQWEGLSHIFNYYGK
jgi:hypothetical protein